MMKTIIIMFLFISLLMGQSTEIIDVTISSSFSDFAAVKAAVEVRIQNANAYTKAKYIVQYWDGESWEYADEQFFWEPTPPVWDQTFDDDVYLDNIADHGDGSFRLGIYSYADYATDTDAWHNFSVTDNMAPSAPSLSLDDTGEHPVLSWNKPTSDTKNYKTYRKSGQYGSWVHRATVTSLTWTETNITLEMPDTHYYFKVRAIDWEDNISGDSNIEDVWGLHKRSAIFAEETDELPITFAIKPNYPNPFNPSTTIEFDLPEDNHVKLAVFNINGQEVANLVDTFVPAGTYNVKFNAENLPSGMYFYLITAGEFRDIKRMLLLK